MIYPLQIGRQEAVPPGWYRTESARLLSSLGWRRKWWRLYRKSLLGAVAAGGGGGGYSKTADIPVTPGHSYTIYVGAGSFK